MAAARAVDSAAIDRMVMRRVMMLGMVTWRHFERRKVTRTESPLST
jgi:hypothetical protein